ncbi:MAG: STAS domain-containing protein [Acidimicrobiia bacterium]|nr:STAS domain-containing protein [Acidimicrobiia bacterium]
MKLDERHSGDVTVVMVTGDITIGAGGEGLLKDKIHSLLQQGRKKLVLDLGGVPCMDSAGLGRLVQSHVTVTNAGGSLKPIGLSTRLNDLLVVTRLVTVFNSYDSEAAALGSF